MIEFFGALGLPGEGYIELRAIWSGPHNVGQQYYPTASGAITGINDSRGAPVDLYFGVLPRIRREGNGDAIANKSSILWQDYDAKAFDGDKQAAFFAMAGVSPVPQIVVDSGHGYHAYWLLDGSYGWSAVHPAMRGIALATRGDNVSDKARILRVPGTLNHKGCRHPDFCDPMPVRLLKLDLLAPRYPLGWFEDYAARLIDDKPPMARPVMTSPENFGELPEWLRFRIEKGRPPLGVESSHGRVDRSHEAFIVAAGLLEHGWDEDAIVAAFTAHPNGIGEKYYEKGKDGPRWLTRTIDSARRLYG